MEDTNVVEYFLVAKLTKEKPVYLWDPEKTEELFRHNGEKFLHPRHALSLKRAILGSEAVEGELNLVEVKTKIFNGDDVETPLAYLKSGDQYQTQLNVVIPDSIVELKLVKGTGPVHILGHHVVSAPNEDIDDDDVEEGDVDLADEFEVDEGRPTPEVNGLNGISPTSNEKKRKNDGNVNGDVKKFKSDADDAEKPELVSNEVAPVVAAAEK